MPSCELVCREPNSSLLGEHYMFLTTEPLEGYFEGTKHTPEQVVTHDFRMCVGAVGAPFHISGSPYFFQAPLQELGRMGKLLSLPPPDL